MDSIRKAVYRELEKLIGRTQLVEFACATPNENTIYLKKECDNPFGSHYDRVYLALFRHYEETGGIKPGDKVLETTSGTAGASFAGVGKALGYDCFVALPAGGEKAREDAIKKHLPQASHLILTPSQQYIAGFPDFLKEFLEKNPEYFFLNHSMGAWNKQKNAYDNNEITLSALEEIAREVIRQENGISCFVPAVGNGSSILGPGRILKKHSPATKIIAFEHFQAAVAFEQKYPGEYEKLFGIKPGSLSRHKLPGTSYQGIFFPHIKTSIAEKIVDEITLVSDAHTDAEYEQLTGKNLTTTLPHWDVEFTGYEDLGRTTHAGIAVALEIAKKTRKQDILVIAYDKADRYDAT